jgi:hypothetical protein
VIPWHSVSLAPAAGELWRLASEAVAAPQLLRRYR